MNTALRALSAARLEVRLRALAQADLLTEYAVPAVMGIVREELDAHAEDAACNSSAGALNLDSIITLLMKTDMSWAEAMAQAGAASLGDPDDPESAAGLVLRGLGKLHPGAGDIYRGILRLLRSAPGTEAAGGAPPAGPHDPAPGVVQSYLDPSYLGKPGSMPDVGPSGPKPSVAPRFKVGDRVRWGEFPFYIDFEVLRVFPPDADLYDTPSYEVRDVRAGGAPIVVPENKLAPSTPADQDPA